MSRHKWNGNLYYSKDRSSVACLKCGMVRQYIGGKPTYFIDDTVYHKAPKCTGKNKEERWNDYSK